MRQRPETAYSISRYKILPNSNEKETDFKPHTVLERRKFSNQVSICSVTPRRQDLIKSTEIKTKKEIHEWIDNKRPNGIQILQQIVKKTRSPYRILIEKALGDLLIAEQRAKKLDEEALLEKSENQGNVEEEILKYQKKLTNLKSENELLKSEIKNNEQKLTSINDDIRNLRIVMKSVKSRISSSDEYEYDDDDSKQIEGSENSQQNKIRKKIQKVVDDETLPKEVRISLYKEEEQKLEKKLMKLEATLMELTLEERKLLNGPYIIPIQESE